MEVKKYDCFVRLVGRSLKNKFLWYCESNYRSGGHDSNWLVGSKDDGARMALNMIEADPMRLFDPSLKVLIQLQDPKMVINSKQVNDFENLTTEKLELSATDLNNLDKSEQAYVKIQNIIAQANNNK